jgi:signal transduction histidine kinase
VQLSVHRSGGNAVLQPHVADEIYWIGREALTNAFRHAQASHVSVELSYGKRYFSMSCMDDGCGFDAGNEKEGHWGLRGMAERARKLGGELRCRSGAVGGTQITLTLPAYRAYRDHSRLMFYLRALQLSQRSPTGAS